MMRPVAHTLCGLFCVVSANDVAAQEQAGAQTYPPVEITDQAQPFRQFERVEITGSSIIRKEQTQALPVQVLTRQDLQRRGHQTVQEAVLNLTSLFNGRDLSQLGSAAGGYANAALHGMPTGTLVLLNGKRLAPFGVQTNSGQENNGADLDFLPLAAIDRIELLTDGASSLYGTDAIAGVINIITRAESQGVELSADWVRPAGGAGQSRIASISWGKGRLSHEGYQLRVTSELSKTDALSVLDRPYAGQGRQFIEQNGQRYSVDGPFVSPYSSPAWLYSPRTSLKAWSALYQDGACTGNGLSYGGNLPTCRLNLYPTFDIYPSRDSQKLHAQAEVLLPNDATLYAEVLYSRTQSQIGVTPWPFMAGPVRNTPGAPGYDILQANGMNPAYSFFYWKPDLPALAQHYDNTQSRVAMGVKGELKEWNYNASLYRVQSTVSKTAQSADYAQAGLNTSSQVLSAAMLQPLDGLNPLMAQLLNSRSWQEQVKGKTSLNVLDFRASRTLFELNGKDVMLGLGGDIKQEQVDSEYNAAVTATPSFTAKRQDKAAYSELQVPVAPDWDVIASLRTDQYSDVGSTTHGKLASRWAINPQWALRGAVGTGFRAPSPGQTLLFASNYYQTTLSSLMTCTPELNALAAGLKPASGATVVGCRDNANIRVFTNGNPELKPEKSRQESLGLAFAPHRNFNIGLDYWRVRMQDTLQFENAQEILADPVKYSAAFVTDPKPYTNATNLIFNDIGVLLKMRNWGQSVKEGLDVDAKYRYPGDWGRWLLGMQGSYLLQSKAKISPQAPWVSDLAIYNSATGVASSRWRSIWMVGLENGFYQAQLNVNHTSGYTDQTISAKNLSTGTTETIAGHKVAGFTTVDVLGMAQLTATTQLRLRIGNLFNAVPPLSFYSASNAVWGVNSQYGNLYGRSLQLGVTHRF